MFGIKSKKTKVAKTTKPIVAPKTEKAVEVVKKVLAVEVKEVVVEKPKTVLVPEVKKVVPQPQKVEHIFSSNQLALFSKKGMETKKCLIAATTQDGFFIIEHPYGKILDDQTILKYKLNKKIAYIFATKNQLTKP